MIYDQVLFILYYPKYVRPVGVGGMRATENAWIDREEC